MELTKILILVNVIVFLLVFSLPQELMIWAFNTFGFTLNVEIWRFFTSLFLHASAAHLFSNMLGLYFFGKVAEEELGQKAFAATYIVSGIIGNLAYGLTTTGIVVGASGCVFGLMAAAMLAKPEKSITMYIIPLPLGLIAILFAAFSTILAVSSPTYAGIAHISHAAGLITGGLIAFYLKPKRSLKSVLILIFFVLLLAVLGQIFSLIIGIGSLILEIIEKVVGFVLYGIAELLRGIWLYVV
jgi:membrane associated rhomboid family serine protease